MKEFLKVRQEEEGFRRLFFDDYFDLYVWYDKRGEAIKGFQLVYNKTRAPRSLTWIEGKGYSHNRIDEGDRHRPMKRAPVLVSDGIFPKSRIIEHFFRASEGIPEEIRDFIMEKLRSFRKEKLDPFI